MRLKTPGIITRLSNLILIQVLFIFAALAFILFAPENEKNTRSRLVELEGKLFEASRVASDFVASRWSVTEVIEESEFDDLFRSQPGIERAVILKLKDAMAVEVLFAYQSGPADTVPDFEPNISSFCDAELLCRATEASQNSGHGSFVDGSYLSHYSILDVNEVGQPTVLVIAAEHGLAVSSRSELQYAILILFLCSTLVSLLTVALLTGKFKQPLDRIISGFEETADGKLHHIGEMEGDPQLGKLARAYNSMAQKLWDQRQKIEAYLSRLAKANSELSEKQQFLSTLIDCSPVAVIVTDADRKIVMFNQSAAETFGYAPETVMGQSVGTLVAHGEPDWIQEADGPACQDAEIVGCRQSGENFPLYLVSRAIETEQTGLVGRLYICRDITESRNFQDMMIRLDRYYTRGEMAGDIAHEINNYLAILMGNVELMPIMLKKGKMDKVDQKLNVMKETLEKIARFSDGLLDSSPETVRLEPTALNQVIENVIAFLKPQNKFDRAEVITELAPDISVLQLDPMQIQQMLVNLIYNAAEALAEHDGEKKIHISTRRITIGGEVGVEVEVRDTGPGVRPDKEPLLFDTRFTTKRRGHGIGLVTCRRIVDNHEGEIGYRLDQGAVFTVKLPVKALNPELEAAAALGMLVLE